MKANRDLNNAAKNFNSYHFVWLLNHPLRSSEWLAEKLKDGFHIHHVDGHHSNNAPENLVLIDGCDHMMIHNHPSFRGAGIKKISLQETKAISRKNRKWRKRYKAPIGPLPRLNYLSLVKSEPANTVKTIYVDKEVIVYLPSKPKPIITMDDYLAKHG